jgi:hypothetical protein
MKPNLFLNPYQQPENKLTYNFLALLHTLNNKELLEWLSDEYLSDDPLMEIETVLGGGRSNPDGCIYLENKGGEFVRIYLENKTNRRGISTEQILAHLDWLKEKDKLLVITPRLSDKNIIKELKNEKILFKTWSDIVEFLQNNCDNVIARQFIEYGHLSGEFDEYGEVTQEDIKLHLESLKLQFDKKISRIFYNFSVEYDFSLYGFKNLCPYNNINWGRNGLELGESIENKSFGQWFSISYYYLTDDHGIPFKRGVPELAFFFDINPEYLEQICNDKTFVDILKKLEPYGFENNMEGKLTSNRWRLFVYRKPVIDFEVININALCIFSDNVFKLLKENGAFEHKYFKELM